MFNINLLHLCKICENASFFGKRIENGSKRVQIPTDPRSIVETPSNSTIAKRGYLSKIQMTLDMSDALDRQQDVVTNIFNQRQQHSIYFYICENLGDR